MPKHPTPCGAWPSPVTAALAAGKTVTLSSVTVSAGAVFWLERRPANGGRTTLVGWWEGEAPQDLTSSGFDVATRVHEYGGGAYSVAGRQAVLSHRGDGGVYVLSLGEGGTTPNLVLVAAGDGLRYADFAVDPCGDWIVAVREDHSVEGEAENTLTLLPTSPNAVVDGGTVIARGADFYTSPRFSPDGRYLAWVEWSHPSMPWDETRLRVAQVVRADGTLRLEKMRTLSGGAESVVEPRWLDDRALLAATDRDGWWNLHRFDVVTGERRIFYAAAEEIGQPHWVFGQQSFSILPDGRVVALSVRNGRARMLLLSPGAEGDAMAREMDLGAPEQCPVLVADRSSPVFAWLDAPSDRPAAIVVGREGELPRVLRAATTLPFAADDIAVAEEIRFPLPDGVEGHALFYPPTNACCTAPEGERPPMIVTAHGGPTARASEAFSFKVQWWTSRGFAVLDVNYSGSTGFGRTYRKRLDLEWGVRDVADCVAAARHVAGSGVVDPERIAIRGSSAGGLTVLAALAVSDVFAAGVSLYGVTDLRALAQETHKFEARYLDGLVGPWPEAEAVYRARSPLFMADRIRAPVLLLQGLEDRVVPPGQARAMVEALRGGGTPCALYEFPGEGHGFRDEATIARVFQIELDFYGRVFGFEPSGLSLVAEDRVTL
ncbi:S9 family peptidase [Acetobacter sacchari]|uniref:S9 family peptidase n=1 Tax=Acetobacter sacchari TaxID=2661687 RepID=A0ABS3LXZ3_9PROT|nr:S9 family peptidase [Acetobacter sacchari]MBO1360775.1 S9 family peptidase [Acetobacter sacchari]